MVAHTYNTKQQREWERQKFKGSLGYIVRLYQERKEGKKEGSGEKGGRENSLSLVSQNEITCSSS